MKALAIHGPNLNLLGTREPEVYGSSTLDEINQTVADLAGELGAGVSAFQANGEGALIDHIHAAASSTDGFIINAGAYTHTSIALRDALLSVGKPFVEVHLSNVFGREPYRQHSYLSDKAVGVVVGFGIDSYLLGLRGLVGFLQKRASR